MESITPVYWRQGVPVGVTLDALVYRLNATDDIGAMQEPMRVADIVADEEMLHLDAIVVPMAKLTHKMNQMQMAMERSSQTVKPIAVQVSEPFTKNGSANVAVVFELSDGQTITVYFHAADATSKTLQPQDPLISWAWKLNKKDVTIVVAPERGKDIAVMDVAKRIMLLATKNSANFARANGKRTDRLKNIETLKNQVAQKQAQLADLTAQWDSQQAAAVTEPAVDLSASEPVSPEAVAKAQAAGFKPFNMSLLRMPSAKQLKVDMSAQKYSEGSLYTFEGGWSNGHILDFSIPAVISDQLKYIQSITDVSHKNIIQSRLKTLTQTNVDRVTNPARDLADVPVVPTASVSGKAAAVVLTNPAEGVAVSVAVPYLAYFAKQYKGAQFYAAKDNSTPIAVKHNGQLVGVLMRLQGTDNEALLRNAVAIASTKNSPAKQKPMLPEKPSLPADEAYPFTGSEAFKTFIARWVDQPTGAFATAKTIDMHAKTYGAQVSWDLVGQADAVYFDGVMDQADHTAVNQALLLACHYLDGVTLSCRDVSHAEAQLQMALANVTHNYPLHLAAGHIEQAELDQHCARSFEHALAVLAAQPQEHGSDLFGGQGFSSQSDESDIPNIVPILDAVETAPSPNDTTQVVGTVRLNHSVLGRAIVSADGRALMYTGETGRTSANGSDAPVSANQATTLVDALLAQPAHPIEPPATQPEVEDLTTVNGIARAIQIAIAQKTHEVALKDVKDGRWGGISIEELNERLRTHMAKPPLQAYIDTATVIINKDVDKLIDQFVHNYYGTSEKIFTRATGVRLARLSKDAKTRVLYQWSGMNEDQVAQRMASNKAQQEAALKAQEEADKAKIAAARQAQIDALDGFGAHLSPALLSKATQALTKKLRIEGSVMTHQDFIRQYVAKGYVMSRATPERFFHKDGTGYAEKNIGKLVFDYAEYMISQNQTGGMPTPEAQFKVGDWVENGNVSEAFGGVRRVQVASVRFDETQNQFMYTMQGQSDEEVAQAHLTLSNNQQTPSPPEDHEVSEFLNGVVKGDIDASTGAARERLRALAQVILAADPQYGLLNNAVKATAQRVKQNAANVLSKAA
ncbi:hypothetical protein GCM10009007_18820 [Formosimonas limnophila]|uniref:Defence against restriction A N-terminal domain-containing protein n=1 Tax=Formosimonas limnophila TaxID=1384487 RepID=A0A8J3CJ04_9BURK|nr:hypothetical protein [Formosimonas limnophila]GHA78134.1 hypothetical protein GCM10009007_18820 [Formosimonas limnophila]